MQKSSRIAKISTKVVGGATFFTFTLYVQVQEPALLVERQHTLLLTPLSGAGT